MGVIGQKWLYSGTVVVVKQSGCVWAKMVVLGQSGCIWAKVVCIRAKCLY